MLRATTEEHSCEGHQPTNESTWLKDTGFIPAVAAKRPGDVTDAKPRATLNPATNDTTKRKESKSWVSTLSPCSITVAMTIKHWAWLCASKNLIYKGKAELGLPEGHRLLISGLNPPVKHQTVKLNLGEKKNQNLITVYVVHKKLTLNMKTQIGQR